MPCNIGCFRVGLLLSLVARSVVVRTLMSIAEHE